MRFRFHLCSSSSVESLRWSIATVAAGLAGELGSLGPRTDDGHITLEDVPELGEFIEPGPAEEPADGGDPRVVGGGPARLLDFAGSKLILTNGLFLFRIQKQTGPGGYHFQKWRLQR